MPHDNLQKYCNLSADEGVSIVVTTGPREDRRIIAEGRYMLGKGLEYPDTAFMVDEKYHGHGIATFLLHYLIEIAQEQGIKGFRGDVIFSNQPMLKVYESVPCKVHKSMSEGVVTVSFTFDEPREEDGKSA